MKFYQSIFSGILLILFSCGKSAHSTNPDDQALIIPGSTGAPTSNIPVIDTLPPTGAVNIKKYGAIGDGTHDDTNSFQTALNSETALFLPTGIYIINNTLNMRPGVKLYGTGGAVIKAGNNMQGTLLSLGRFIYIYNANNSSITNITFQQSAQAFNLSNYANACIYISNSKDSYIAYNFFDFNLPYRTSGLEAVWVTGPLSANTIIKHNRLISTGIEYAEDGAGTTTVDGNNISLSPEDGISAHGNSKTQACSNNIVINNTIQNPGFMGIEDWGNIEGTLINNNTITGTGKDPSQIGGGMGISAVGRNTTVSNNTITNAVLYYIESGGSKQIINNVLNDTQGIATGIILNFTAPGSPDHKDPTVVSGNIINNCSVGILMFGNYSPAATLLSNTLNNPVSIGISFDSSSPDYNINIAHNTVNFTIPNINLRTAYGTYTTLSQRTVNQLITLDNNTATYAATAIGGKDLDKGFVIATDNTIINANTIYGNFVTAGKSLVYGIAGNTNPAKQITLTNNKVYGAIVNLKDFTYKSKYGNNFN